jgi:HSP20 family protein
MMTIWGAIPSLDRVLDEATRAAPRSGRAVAPAFPIAADLRETPDAYVVQADLPGVKLEDLELTLERHVLVLRGQRRFEQGPHERVTCGRPHGPFAASYALPEGIDGERLTADLADGVLTIRVPKQPQVQARKIPIASGDQRDPSNA